MMYRYLLSAVFLALVLCTPGLRAQDSARTSDPRLPQLWSSEYGYSFNLPEKAKYNKLGSEIKKEGQTERQNFILSGGNGAITIYHYAEPRMVPKDYKLLDSIHYFDIDSTGRNGMIHRRIYILKDVAIQMDILLTEKGEATYGELVEPIFASFVPPPGAEKTLDAWRYGRDPKEFEHGRYAPNQGPDRR
jgi:hypothetical protein